MPPNEIAVIGMACWFPGAPGVRQFWENILACRREFRSFPPGRLRLEDYHDPGSAAVDKTYARRAAFIDGFDFDWASRRIPKRTVDSTDVVHWLALEVALKALEDAGYSPKSVPTERSGAVVGNSLTGEVTRATSLRLRWPYVRRALRAAGRALPSETVAQLESELEGIYKSAFPPPSEDTLAGALSNTIAGRICNFLDFHGGGYTVDGACASSLLAVATAANALARRDLDLALAGGVDISLDAFELVGFSRVGAMSREDIRVFDRRGDGFLPGEGCGFVLLKRLEDARRDGDYVYAVLEGWGISSDGRGGITAPSSAGQALALRRAYEQAGTDPRGLAFIEGHGTATRVGDRTELVGMAQALAHWGEVNVRGIGVTSVKSIIGHAKAAAGIAGLIKAVMAANRRVLPPTAECVEPHAAFDSEARCLYPLQRGRLLDSAEVIRAGVSGFGFGGINCHVALRSGDAPSAKLEPMAKEQALLASRQATELFVFSAPSLPALVARVRAVREEARGVSVGELVDLAAHLAAAVSADEPVRAAILAGTPDELEAKLEELARLLERSPPEEGAALSSALERLWVGNRCRAPRLGFAFPGQGSQQLNAARRLIERFEWAAELARELDRRRAALGYEPVLPYLLRDEERAASDAERAEWAKALARTEIAQPAIVLSSLIWARYLGLLGLRPSAVIGHSLGELVAFHAAGLLELGQLFELASVRGRAMAAKADRPGAMASLKCSAKRARALLEGVSGYAVIANVNGPEQVVVSGEEATVDAAVARAAEQQVAARRLAVSNAFHSALVAPAAEVLASYAGLPRAGGAPSLTLVSAVDGRAVGAGVDLRAYFSKQVLASVEFLTAARTLAEQVDVVLEVGPGRVLCGLLQEIAPGKLTALPVETRPGKDQDLNAALAHLFTSGANPDWSALYGARLVRPFVAAARRRFVENPCDRPLAAELSQAGSSSASASWESVGDAGIATPLLAELRDLGRAELSGYLARRSKFLGRIIRADLDEGGHPSAPAALPAAERAAPKPPAPVSPPEGAGAEALTLEAAVMRLIAARTGFPEESLEPRMRLLDDLNLDSIKAGELIGAAAKQQGVAGAVDPAPLLNASIAEVVEAIRKAGGDSAPAPEVAPGASTGEVSVELALMRLVAGRTGYPEQSLEPRLRLLDDLNLDSIKAGELIGAAAGQHGVAGAVDPAPLLNASIADIAQAIQRAGGSGTPAPAPQRQEPRAQRPREAVLEALEEVVGYPKGRIDDQALLGRDLQLDPQKLQAVVRRATEILGVRQRVDIEPLLERTPAQLAEILARLGEAQGAAPAERTPPAPGWVRQFAVGCVEAPRPEVAGERPHVRQEDRWDAAQVLLVAAQPEDEFAGALRDALTRQGARVELIDVDRLQRAGTPAGPEITHFIALFPRTVDPADEGLTQRSVRLLRQVGDPPAPEGAPRRRTTLAYVQFSGGHFGSRGKVEHFATGAAVSFAASVHQERPDLRVRVLDLSPAADLEVGVAAVLEELTTSEAFAAVGLDSSGVRWVPTLGLQTRAALTPRPHPIGREDVILATGGAKGITAECVLAAARASGAKVALVGSSPHPSLPGAGTGSAEIARTLERMAAEGIFARYYSCDISDPAAVRALVERVGQEVGAPSVVIHGAAVNKPRRVTHSSVEGALAEIGPKLLGGLNLCAALHRAPPKLIVGFTSISGVIGLHGNAWYAFSNEALDRVFGQFAEAHPETEVTTLAFSLWAEVGMAARMGSSERLAEKGVDTIPLEEGLRHFLQLFQHRSAARQVVVTGRHRGMVAWRGGLQPALPRCHRFLEQVVAFEPGVELAARAHLTLDEDRYLHDHQFRGSYLFPMVLGLEAMAQAAACVTGRSALGPVRIHDLRLDRPVVVDPADGADVEVRALVLEAGEPDQRPRVRAAVRTAQSGFAVDHFSAELELDIGEAPAADIDLSSPPLEIQPREDIYGPLLFHGPSYQRLERYHHLTASGAVYLARLDVAHAAENAFARSWGGPPLLGDPFFRDAMLQGGQAVIAQDLGLPLQAKSVEIYPPSPADDGLIACAEMLTGRGDNYFDGEVFAVTRGGRVLDRFSGWRVRVVEHRPENPTAEELAAPDSRDAELVRARAKALADQLSLSVPAIALRHVPRLAQRPVTERREVEVAMLREALGFEAGDASATPRIVWQPSGRPEVVESELGVALAHDEGVCFGVAGPGPQGCDVEPIAMHGWSGAEKLLGSARLDLVRELMDGGDAVDEAVTRVWTALEACIKATGAVPSSFRAQRRVGGAVVLAPTGAQGPNVVLTFPLKLARGRRRMFALFCSEAQEARPVEAQARAPEERSPSPFEGMSELKVRRLHPEGAPYFESLEPLSFKEITELGGTPSFVHYVRGIGRLRELGLWPQRKMFLESMRSGGFGMVTNRVKVEVVGSHGLDDQVRCYFWAHDPEELLARGAGEARAEWNKALPNGRRAAVARASLEFSWVRITGHGLVEPARMPDPIERYFRSMHLEADGPPERADPREDGYRHLERGDSLWRATVIPSRRTPLLEHAFSTTLEDSNLVGNVYFAKYLEWQSRLRDTLLFRLDPELLRNQGARGELLTTSAGVEYLREAMPFDTIRVRMHLEQVWEKGIHFSFEYFKERPEGSLEKLAVGSSSAVWVVGRGGGEPAAAPLPAPLLGLGREGAIAKAG